METTLYKASDILICTCSNHILLAAGSICELCMGFVTELAMDEVEIKPEINRFDDTYFEALERWYEDMEFAA